MNSEEKKYQKQFCDRYFGKTTWDQEVNRVDVVLKGKRGQNLLYIEFKYLLNGQQAHRKALAQIIITNKKRPAISSTTWPWPTCRRMETTCLSSLTVRKTQ